MRRARDQGLGSDWRIVRTAAAVAFVSAAALACGEAANPARQEVATGPAQKGEASYYGTRLAGEKTVSGERLDPNRLTAASPTLPLGAKAKVTNEETGQSTKVTITDRGPGVPGRIIDVTPKAAEHLGIRSKGVADVTVQPVKPPAPR
jgi:rare lipoprotein A